MQERDEASGDDIAEAEPTGVELEIESDPTLGYASIQNAVPVIRSLRLTNHGPDPVSKLQVLVYCSPRFAQGTKLRFERLAPQETRRVSPVDLHPDHAFLSELQESVKASVKVSVLSGTQVIASQARPIEVLAYDQWAGTRALPELLAAFCMPNNPAVDVLLGKASSLLRSASPELSMNGYQSKSREVVWKQVSAIYSTLCAENLQYAEPPASFGTDGQKIRTPERVLEGRVATCLDLSMLVASCIEQAGLRPVVLFMEGHAWIGVWLHQACFADPLTDDVQAVRKRVDSGELLVFETTGIAQHASHRPSLRIAMEQGKAHLADGNSFRYVVDIHRAREVQIRPLPSRDGPLTRSNDAPSEQPMGIEATPVLPDLDPASLAPIDMPTSDTPEGRLANWKSRLLDLTLRNRLLNFKQTKTTVQLVAPDLARLEDALAEGAEFRIRPLPSIMEGQDPRMSEVHRSRGGNSPLDDMALEALRNSELLARLHKSDLDGQLLSIFSAARTGLEEGGANTLFLAIGFLKWTEVAKADATHLAPILLVPVTLHRQSVHSGFRLSRHDDEAIVNPTLLQLLRTSFELPLTALEVLPSDDRGVDVAKVLQTFRLAVRDISQWEVLEQACLGIFSFTKYLMWKDLQDRTEQLKANSVVRHLIENPGQAFEQPARDERLERLDHHYAPQDIFAPLLCDSSQLKALCAVDGGQDLVMEGPPGTGKSQTITNLIAHSLTKGKTVLFVSEKMAALEVVHRRLNAIGLGPFCLELHSSKSRKSEVLQQLGQALETGGQRTAEDWAREADRLARLRSELNGFVDALHKRYPNGLSAFDAMGTCIEHSDGHPSSMPWPDPLTHDRDALDTLRETARRMASLAGALGTLGSHPLAQIGQSQWTPTWQDELMATVQATDDAIRVFREKAQAIAPAVGMADSGLSMQTYAALDKLADVLLAAPKVPPGLARQAHDPAARARVKALTKHGVARAQHWGRLGDGWLPNLARLNAAEWQGNWSQATAAWWPKSWFAQRSITGRLMAFRVDGKRPTAEQVQAMLDPLGDVNDEDAVLRSMNADAQALLEDAYEGLRTDWEVVARHERWATQFSDVVALASSGDPEQSARVTALLQPLVAENRALLAPTGSVGRALLAYRDAWRVVQQKLRDLAALAKPVEALSGPDDADGAMERILAFLSGWSAARRQLQPWCLWRDIRDKAITQGLQEVVRALEDGTVALSDIEGHFEFSYRNWWLKKVIDIDPALRSFSSADHERKIREFRQADERFQQLTQQYTAATLAGRVPSTTAIAVGADSEMGRLRRELQKQRRHMPVRQLVQGMPTLLPKLKPCLLMSPLSVAQYLAAGYAPCDLVVFDEASQIPVWDAVGAIARGRQLVVVGDPKQLPPTNFFTKSTDGDGPAGSDDQLEDLESILDECLGAGMNRLGLQWHYRSRHESLIAFSNVTYYESRLVTFPSPVTDDIAVRVVRVHGAYDRGGSRTNRAEADAIVAGIEAHYLRPAKQGLTLGVVTFNQPQQALIETLLEARRGQNAALDRAIAACAAEPLFIKNLENVQGDERDIIFFSITYGPDLAGKVTMNFGPLNGEGGHRRLNVAISRAREGVVVYSALQPEQIDLARVRAAGVRDLKHYLEFALRGPRALVEQSVPTGREPDSPFEAAIIRALRNKGWTLHPQVGCSGYRVDIGVVDPRAPGRYLAGIECDGRMYHSGATARDRDRLRQHVLENLGWCILRIWSTDWWHDAEGEIDKISGRLQDLLEQEDSGPDLEGETAETPAAVNESQSADIDDMGDDIEAPSADTPPTDGDAVGQRIYRPVDLPPGNPARFHEHPSSSLLTAQLVRVIDEEGPIPEAVLFRRVARAWGLERTGARIVERLRRLVPPTTRRTQEADVTFYWPASADPQTWTIFRTADSEPASRRSIHDVSQQEIAALVKYVLHHGGSAPRSDIARSVCRLVGMARTPADAEARVKAGIEWLVSQGEAREHDGYLRE